MALLYGRYTAREIEAMGVPFRFAIQFENLTKDIDKEHLALNGSIAPGAYNAAITYSEKDYCLYSGFQYVCISSTTGIFVLSDWDLIGVIPSATKIKENTDNLSAHEQLNSAHGATGDNVGNEDYCTNVTGGVVLLASLISDLTPVSTSNATSAPVAYDQAQAQTVVVLANANKAKINEIVTKLNEILAGQITAKQMNSI